MTEPSTETPEVVAGELVPLPRRGEVIQPLEVGTVKDAMQSYQRGVRELLDPSDYQSAGRDRRTGKERRFVKKSGLRKVATWFDLSVELLRDEVDRGDDGTILRATVWARATAANGRFFDGDGHCDASEERFTDDRGRQKLENDLRATAATRAMNRAISGLIGLGDLDETGEGVTGGHGAEVDADTRRTASQACLKLTAGDVEAAQALYATIAQQHDGHMPQAAAVALIAAADAVPQPEAREAA